MVEWGRGCDRITIGWRERVAVTVHGGEFQVVQDELYAFSGGRRGRAGWR